MTKVDRYTSYKVSPGAPGAYGLSMLDCCAMILKWKIRKKVRLLSQTRSGRC